MSYYGGYGESMDADKQSNYHEWKKTAHIITDVEIKIETTGISVEDLHYLNECLIKKDFFFMGGSDGILLVSPIHLTIKNKHEYFTYKTFKQLVNAVKLMLFNYNKIYTIDKVEEMIEYRQTNEIINQIKYLL
jgi:hypothetical protein